MSEGFSADWLALREPYDAQARSASLLARLAAWRGGHDMLRVVDLGAGTGSNLRVTAAALGGAQDWTLVELDPALIAAGHERLAQAEVAWRYRRLDLAQDLERLGEQPVDLIAASALLDLVDAAWLSRLVAWRAETGAALHIALTFDGRIEWRPPDDGDSVVAGLVLAHQHGDKGFGPALGPNAVAVLRSLLAGVRGELLVDASDWALAAADRAIQAALLDSYAAAAGATAPEQRATTEAWQVRRRRLIAAGRSSLRVGHLDLLFLPEA